MVPMMRRVDRRGGQAPQQHLVEQQPEQRGEDEHREDQRGDDRHVVADVELVVHVRAHERDRAVREVEDPDVWYVRTMPDAMIE